MNKDDKCLLMLIAIGLLASGVHLATGGTLFHGIVSVLLLTCSFFIINDLRQGGVVLTAILAEKGGSGKANDEAGEQ